MKFSNKRASRINILDRYENRPLLEQDKFVKAYEELVRFSLAYALNAGLLYVERVRNEVFHCDEKGPCHDVYVSTTVCEFAENLEADLKILDEAFCAWNNKTIVEQGRILRVKYGIYLTEVITQKELSFLPAYVRASISSF